MNKPCPCPNPSSLYFRLKPINCLRRESFGCKSIPSFNFASCKSRKTSPRTSTIVHFIFYFGSFEISVNILRNQKYLIGLDSYSRQVSNYLDPILIYIDCLFEIRKIAVCFLWLSLPGHYRVTDEALLVETT